MSNQGSNKDNRIVRSPPVRTTDLKNGTVKIEIFIPDLVPGRDKYHPKGGKIHLDFFNKGYSFDMIAELKDKTNTKITKGATNTKITEYKFSVKRLPGRINIEETKWGVEKGQIVIMMEKHPEFMNSDWGLVVFENGGLEQCSSSSSSSSDDD